MTRRFLIFSFAAGLLALGGLNAQAGQIPLPTDLGTLSTPGNFTAVPTPSGNLTFSDLTYSASPIVSPPAVGDVTVKNFSAGIENGLTFSGAFFAPAGATVDYAITYLVTAPPGFTFTNATLSGVLSTLTGNGTASVNETLLNAATGAALGTLGISPTDTSNIINFPAGVNSLIVDKDVILAGGSMGASVSIINQGYSTIPEPTSMALLGIGLSGLFTLRRFLKRTSVA
jgi:PEP-CTERM motif